MTMQFGCGGSCGTSWTRGVGAMNAAAAAASAADDSAPAHDGACCSKCADGARRAARLPRLMRVMQRAPSGRSAIRTPASGAMPFVEGPAAAHLEHALAERAGAWPRISPQQFLDVLARDVRVADMCAWWASRLTTERRRLVHRFEEINPGAIGVLVDRDGFLVALDQLCASRARMRSWMRRSGDVGDAAGSATWSPAGTPAVAIATDADGTEVQLDASGNPIAGTTTNRAGDTPPEGDAAWSGTPTSVYGAGLGGEVSTSFYGTGDVSTVSGGGSSASGGGGLTDAQVRAISTNVGTFISTTGTDIATAIQQANQTQRAEIAAGVQRQHDADQMALSSATDAATRARLEQQLHDEQEVLRLLQAQQSHVSTPVVVGGLAVAAGIATKLLGWW